MNREHIITANETVKDIAARLFGNVNEWYRIVILNNLEYPYIGIPGQSYTGKVLFPGNILRLPADSKQNDATYFASRNIQNLDYQDLFLGRDIGLTDGQLSIVVGSDGKDFFTVSGKQNLIQAILNKFSTPLGSLNYYPKYGSLVKRTIGENNDSPTINRLRADCAKTVRQDARISNVNSISIVSDGLETVNVTMQISTRAGVSLGVSVPLDSVILQV